MSVFSVEIVAPDKKVWEGNARLVSFRTLEGSMGVLDKRAPILVALDIAPLVVETEKGKIEFAVHGGMLKMDGEKLIILTDAAEKADDIDLYRAEAAKKRALNRLEKAKNDMEKLKANISIQKNMLRLDIGKKN